MGQNYVSEVRMHEGTRRWGRRLPHARPYGTHAESGARNPRRRLSAAVVVLQTARVGPRQAGRAHNALNRPKWVRAAPLLYVRGPEGHGNRPIGAGMTPWASVARRAKSNLGPKPVKSDLLQKWPRTLWECETDWKRIQKRSFVLRETMPETRKESDNQTIKQSISPVKTRAMLNCPAQPASGLLKAGWYVLVRHATLYSTCSIVLHCIVGYTSVSLLTRLQLCLLQSDMLHNPRTHTLRHSVMPEEVPRLPDLSVARVCL